MPAPETDACAQVQQQRIDVRVWKATATHKPDVTVKENCRSSVTRLTALIKAACTGQDKEVWPVYTLHENVPAWSISADGQLTSSIPVKCSLNEQLITVECSKGSGNAEKKRNVTYEPFCSSKTCDAVDVCEEDNKACSSMNAQQCQFVNCLAHLQSVQTVSTHQTGVCKIWSYVGWDRESGGDSFFLPDPVTKASYMQLKSNNIKWVVPAVCVAMLWSFFYQTPLKDRIKLRQTDRGLKFILVSAIVFTCIGVLAFRKIM